MHLHKTRITCLSCNTTVALPAPPLPGDPGPPFLSPSDYPEPPLNGPGPGPGDGDGNGRSISPSPIRTRLASLGSALAADGPVRRARMAKVARRGKGRVPFHAREAQVGGKEDGGAGAVEGQNGARSESGHVLWRGEERLSGWGG